MFASGYLNRCDYPVKVSVARCVRVVMCALQGNFGMVDLKKLQHEPIAWRIYRMASDENDRQQSGHYNSSGILVTLLHSTMFHMAIRCYNNTCVYVRIHEYFTCICKEYIPLLQPAEGRSEAAGPPPRGLKWTSGMVV